jgi:riboflavin-specific deaminase-like protein
VLTSCYISNPISSEPVTFRRLYPPGEPAGAHAIVAGLGLHEHPPPASPGRPYVALNMASTLDGRASIAGRSAPISGPADRVLFHGLRSLVDAVMAGAGTVRAERYGPIVRDPDRRRERLGRGLSEQPLACIVSGRLDLPPDLPLLADPASRVAIVTASPSVLPPVAAHLDYVRTGLHGRLDLPTAFVELQDRLQIRTLLCEGGPHLNAHLLSAGLVDELFLSLSPKLAGDPAGGEAALRILAGAGWEPPLQLRLISVLESESQLFLRYRVLGGA